MTDQDIVAEYLRREKRAMGTQQGADHNAIIYDVATLANRNFGDVSRLVIAAIFSEPN